MLHGLSNLPAHLVVSRLPLLKAHNQLLTTFRLPNLSYKTTTQIAAAINLWAARSLPIIIMLGVIEVASDAYRITRLKRAEA